MNKVVITIIAVVAVAALVFGVFGFIRAGRVNDFNYRGAMLQQGFEFGPGMMGRQGSNGDFGPGMMGRQGNNDDYGPGMMGGRKGAVGSRGFTEMHDYMEDAVAEKFGVTVDELNSQLKDGKSILDIAAEKGLTVAEFQTMQKDAMTSAIDKALAAGEISQNQADLMKENLLNGMMGGFGHRRR
jgi:hypothetical protein